MAYRPLYAEKDETRISATSALIEIKSRQGRPEESPG
jgi:hypothetical protein